MAHTLHHNIMAFENTQALLDDVLRESGLYEKARKVLRDYAEKSIGSQPSLPGAHPKDIFDALRQAGLVDELLDAIHSAGIVLDEGTLRVITGSKAGSPVPSSEVVGSEAPTPTSKRLTQEGSRTLASGEKTVYPHDEIDPTRRQLFLEVGKGKVFLSHLSEAFMEISQVRNKHLTTGSAAPEPLVHRYYVLHFYCNGQKFSTVPIPTSIEPDFPSLDPPPQYVVDVQPQNESTLAALSSLLHSNLTIPTAFLTDISGETLPGGRGNSQTPYSYSDATSTVPNTVANNNQADPCGTTSKLPPRPLLPTYHSAYFILHVKLTMITEHHEVPRSTSPGGETSTTAPSGTRPPPVVTTELIGSAALDWRGVLSAKNGCLNTLLPLAPAGVMRHQSIGPAGEMLPVGLLPISVSLLPVPPPSALLSSLDVRYSQQQLAMTYAERLKSFHQYSIAWYREFKSLHPSFASRYVRMYGECEEWGSGTIAGPVPLRRTTPHTPGVTSHSLHKDRDKNTTKARDESGDGSTDEATRDNEHGEEHDDEENSVQGRTRSAHDRFSSTLEGNATSDNTFATNDLDFPTSIRMLPLCSFLTPIADETLIPTAETAARFVSLLPYHTSMDAEEVTLGPPSRSVHIPEDGTNEQKPHGSIHPSTAPGIVESQVRPQWRGLASILTCLGGTVQDHAVLLCSLFLGLSLDAYVVIGTQTRTVHSDAQGRPLRMPLREEREAIWVMTRYLNSEVDTSSGTDIDTHTQKLIRRYKAVFWDPISGKDYLADSFADAHNAPVLEDGWKYKELHCVFSDSEFYASVAGDAGIAWIVKHIGFDFASPMTAGWKGMDSTFLSLLPHTSPVPLSPPSSVFQDVLELESLLEKSLKHLIEEFRTETAADEITDNLYSLLQEFPPSVRPGSPDDIVPTLTKWNTKIERVMCQALETYERNASVSKDPLSPLSPIHSDGTSGQPLHHSRHVQAAFKRVIPKGYVFQGFPICFSTLSPTLILQNLLNSPGGKEVLQTPFLPDFTSALHTNENLHAWKESNQGTCFALRVKVIPFPHDIAAVWVMLGAIRPNEKIK